MPATRARAKAVRYLAFLAPQGSEDPDMPTRIILDCDPGIDDALAIAFAHGHPGIELAGITTVAGNVGLAKTTANALAVCEF
ncbi:MAG TPA: nucleoside hydrolase, partial [Streptosporangiaceae bacterium]